jgi:hypothetical protein
VKQVDRKPIRREFRRAWIWFGLIFVGEIFGQIVGHIIALAFGNVENDVFAGPFWQKLVILIPSSFLMIAPCVMTARIGRRLVKSGEQLGWFHLIVGTISSLVLISASIIGLFTT